MLRIYANNFMALGAESGSLEHLLYLSKSAGDPLTADERQDIVRHVQKLRSLCRELDMPMSAHLLGKAELKPPLTMEELIIYLEALTAELKTKLFFFVPTERAKYYGFVPLSQPLLEQFPMASKELKSAGNCHAFGEYTAAVFHSMRAAEIALKAMAKSLKIKLDVDAAQWKNILDQIDKQVRELEQGKRSAKRDERKQFYGSAASQFRYFKDAWRNYVAHAKASYSEGESITVMDHVAALLETLSARLVETR